MTSESMPLLHPIKITKYHRESLNNHRSIIVATKPTLIQCHRSFNKGDRTMSNKQNNHKANQANSNKGTSGHNTTYQKAQDNRANQLNPNNSRYQGKK